MVIQSHINYTKHKQEVYDMIESKYGAERSKQFIDFYANRFDKYGRSLLHYRLAWWLTDDYYKVKNKGTMFYACVGSGGTGKTTLMKNVFYYLDPTFDLSRVNLKILDFMKKLDEFPVLNSMRGLFLDEPDDDFHVTSKVGRKLRDVLGKARQQHLFIGICATTLTDIPMYIFKKLDCIFFLPNLGNGMCFKNMPAKGSYPLDNIRREYQKKGYSIFFELKKTVGCLRFATLQGSPFSAEEEKKYIGDKAADYKETIKEAIEGIKEKPKLDSYFKERGEKINELLKKGLEQKQIAEILGLSQQRISQIIKKQYG